MSIFFSLFLFLTSISIFINKTTAIIIALIIKSANYDNGQWLWIFQYNIHIYLNLYATGLERVAEELMGRRKWKHYQESLAQSHATDLLTKQSPSIGKSLTK